MQRHLRNSTNELEASRTQVAALQTQLKEASRKPQSHAAELERKSKHQDEVALRLAALEREHKALVNKSLMADDAHTRTLNAQTEQLMGRWAGLLPDLRPPNRYASAQ